MLGNNALAVRLYFSDRQAEIQQFRYVVREKACALEDIKVSTVSDVRKDATHQQNLPLLYTWSIQSNDQRSTRQPVVCSRPRSSCATTLQLL